MSFVKGALTLGLLAILPIEVAKGAEVTELPQALKATAALEYRFLSESGSIDEDDYDFGKRKIERHELVTHLEFAPVSWACVFLEFGSVPHHRRWFEESYEPVVDRQTGLPTFVGAEQAESDPSFEGKGFTGAWVGLAFAPFPQRQGAFQPLTWRLEASWRAAHQKHTIWSVDGKGRGAANGASAWRLKGAFSADLGSASPFVRVSYTHEGDVELELADESGALSASNITLHAPSRFDLRSGVELLMHQAPNNDTQSWLQLFLDLGLRGEEWAPTGFHLPTIFKDWMQEPAIRDEHLWAGLGLGMRFDFSQWARWSFSLRSEYDVPHHLDQHLPAVYQGPDTVHIELGTSLLFAIP